MSNLTVAEIEQVLRGYAAGDVFGVAFEFVEYRGEIDPDCLLEKEGWPYGGVSDDSLLSLLTIESLNPKSSQLSQDKFLAELELSIPRLRGLGPTTRAALGLPVKVHELPQVGISNGALMRTSLLGLAFQESEAGERRHFVRALAETTHKSATAIGCALIGSALFADARSHGNAHSAYEVARRELELIEEDIALSDWSEPICTGVSNESTETLNAVLWALKTSTCARDALQISCELGGDTDTVAALTTALIVARERGAADFQSIPWLKDILWSDISGLSSAALFLHNLYQEKKIIS
ncbi:DraG ADP-ribosylglycohydrolase [Candidatus Nanopelagicaceae bacterium]